MYNTSEISIGDFSVISQEAYLCCGSHDFTSHDFSFVTEPITIDTHAWVAARAIILKGVHIGEGAVIGAGSVVSRDVPPWTVVTGNPAKIVREYERR